MSENITRLEQLRLDGSEAINLRIRDRLAKGIGLKHCYRVGYSSQYTVRMGLGGKQWDIAKHPDRATAVRIADCATIYFWRYRHTRRMPPSDADLNLSVEQAKRDMETCPDIPRLLAELAEQLKTKGIIHEPVADIPQQFCYIEHRPALLRSANSFFVAIEVLAKHADKKYALHISALNDVAAELRKHLSNVDRVLSESE